MDLDVCQMLIFCDEAISVVDLQMAFGYLRNDSSRGGSHPEVRSILSLEHERPRRKIHCAAHVKVMRASGQAVTPIVEAIQRHPGNALVPWQLEHIHGRKCGCSLRRLVYWEGRNQ